VTATTGEEPDAHALAHTPTFDAVAKGINHPDGLVARHPWPLDSLGAVIADAGKPRPGILVEAPAFWALVAGGVGPVQRRLAFAPVKAAEMAAPQ